MASFAHIIAKVESSLRRLAIKNAVWMQELTLEH